MLEDFSLALVPSSWRPFSECRLDWPGSPRPQSFVKGEEIFVAKRSVINRKTVYMNCPLIGDDKISSCLYFCSQPPCSVRMALIIPSPFHYHVFRLLVFPSSDPL